MASAHDRRAHGYQPAADLAAVLGVAAVAAFFRLYRLDSVPRGLHGDEALNGLDILFTIPASHPIFFEANNGREPLFIYLQSVFVALLGPTQLALRLPAALLGVATVLAIYWLGRQWLGRWVGLLAALGLAVSFWHVELSRIGLRAGGVALWVTLTLGLLWHGLRQGSTWPLLLGGVTLSLGLYTYPSARLLPALLLLIAAWELLVTGRALLRRWPGLAAGVLVAALLTAPLGLYYADHPAYLTLRADQVSIFNPRPDIQAAQVTFRENLLLNLGMAFVHGEDKPRFNQPGRPVFTPLGNLWLLVGLAIALRSLVLAARRRGRLWPPHPGRPPVVAPTLLAQQMADDPLAVWRRDQRAGIAAGWLVLWTFVMYLPGVLAYESPSFIRLSALAPAVFLLWGLGLAKAAEALGKLGRRVGLREAIGVASAVAISALVVGNEAASTFGTYFAVWAPSQRVYRDFDASLVSVAAALEHAPASTIVVYADHHRASAVEYLSPAARRARWVQGYGDVLLLPDSSAADAVYVLADFSYGAEVAGRYFAGLSPFAEESDPAGDPAFLAYRLSAPQLAGLRQPDVLLGRPFGEQVELIGYTPGRRSAVPGDRVSVTLIWRALADAVVAYSPYLHVLDDHGHGWWQEDLLAAPADGWRKGDEFVSRMVWRVPADAAALTYRLEAGMARRPVGWPPGSPTALGQPVGVGQVRVDRNGPISPDAPGPTIAIPVGQDLGGGLWLAGFTGNLGPRRPGETLELDLHWEARRALDRDVIADVALVDAAGQAWARDRNRPVYGTNSTAGWPAGTVLRDPRLLTIGAAPGGPLRLVVTTVDARTGDELGRAELGTVEVGGSARSFDLPPMQHSLDAVFGGQIALRGYDLAGERVAPGDKLALRLYWQALTIPDRSYTVFTHLLDAQQRVVSQQDSQPARGQSPTAGWVAGQVILDDYSLQIGAGAPPSELTLEVGLYDATTGTRLKLAGGDDRLILERITVAPP